jgi:hypothetical protein
MPGKNAQLSRSLPSKDVHKQRRRFVLGKESGRGCHWSLPKEKRLAALGFNS